MIQIDRETFQMMLHQIMERFDKIEDRLGRMNRQTAALSLRIGTVPPPNRAAFGTTVGASGTACRIMQRKAA